MCREGLEQKLKILKSSLMNADSSRSTINTVNFEIKSRGMCYEMLECIVSTNSHSYEASQLASEILSIADAYKIKEASQEKFEKLCVPALNLILEDEKKAIRARNKVPTTYIPPVKSRPKPKKKGLFSSIKDSITGFAEKYNPLNAFYAFR